MTSLRKKNLLPAIIAATLLVGSAHASPIGFTDFVGFGDSLSDKGRLPEILATQPPQDGSRFSDGPTWMERLGEIFEDRGGENINLALGGATAAENTPERAAGYAFAEALNGPRDATNPDDIPFADLRSFATQVGSFFTSGLASTVGENPFVTVLLGGNDFRALPDTPTPVDFATVGGNVITSIMSGITTMAMADTKFDDFMVSNLPSFTKTPSLFNVDPLLKLPADLAIQNFNLALAGSMASLSNSLDVNIEIFDLYSTFDAVYADGLANGLIGDESCLPAAGVNNCPVLGDSASYLFLDDIHPNAFIQNGIGNAAISQLDGRIAPVPLPAGLPLLLIGLAGFAAVRARRIV